MKRLAFVAWIFLAFVVAGCATPQTVGPAVSDAATAAEQQKQLELVVRAQFDAAQKVYAVADSLLLAGAPLCKDNTVPKLGLRFGQVGMAPGYADMLRREFGLTDAVTVLAVARNSPAAKAGLQRGDAVVSANGTAIAESPEGFAAFSEVIKANPGSAVALEVRRGKTTLKRSIAPAPACNYEIVVSSDQAINAGADGSKVVINRGLVEYVTRDEELAVVIGHEIAHNIMGHAGAKRQNMAAGAVGGIILDIGLAVLGVNTGGAFTKLGMEAGRAAYSKDFEREADYVGTYLVGLAGYDIEQAPNVWRRMAVSNPRGIAFANTHPTSAERFVAMEATVKEIIDKRARREALVPNLKPSPSAPASSPVDAGNALK